ncbi:MAG: N-6 DNA methylase [Bryobacterales bacterium]|nr:N-6 DNA methylase [Bryobacterales bacterium]
MAFEQHMVASLKPDGMTAVVLPHGILFRRRGGFASGRGCSRTTWSRR